MKNIKIFTAINDTWKCVYWPQRGMWHICGGEWTWTHLDRIESLLGTYRTDPIYTEHKKESTIYKEILESWLI